MTATRKQVHHVEKLSYRIKEAAAALSLSETTLWRMRRDGKLRTTGEGRLTRVPASEVMRIASGMSLAE